jgi:thiamine-monophosphate kinase
MSTSRRISQLGEFGWLKKLIPRLYWPGSLDPQLCIGPGDDAGVLRITRKKVLVATTDTMVEGVHFEKKWLPPRDLGEKLLAVNISDLAAMGDVKPLAALVTVSFPGDTPVDTVDKFYKGLRSCAQRWKIGFLGGDTVGSKRDWVVSATVLGEANPRHLVRRDGARKGDLIAVIGPLGLATAGLEVLQKNIRRLIFSRPLLNAFLRPQPQIHPGSILGRHRLAHGMLDASDGLEASIKLLAEGAKLGAELDLDRIPVHPALRQWAQMRHKDPMSYVLRGGEDYALVFTVSPARWPEVQRRLPAARHIGRMVPAREGVYALRGNKKMALTSYGYAHF